MTGRKWLLGITTALAGSFAVAQAPGGAPPQGGGPPAGGNGGPPAEIVALFKTCDADLKVHCSGKEGPDAMMCLMAAKEKVSATCKEALGKLPAPPQGGGGPPSGGGAPGGNPPPK